MLPPDHGFLRGRCLLQALLALVLVACSAPLPGQPTPDDVIYFVLTDRFDDGNPGNNYAGRSPFAPVSEHGFLANSERHYHGGDLRGLINNLDYLQNLGITAIWITPPFENQFFQVNSAAYHGYWIRNFLNIDPHLGTDADFREFAAAAHNRGIKVILDIVANHTADIIFYQENQYAYRPKGAFPYRDANGSVFDDRDVVFTGDNAGAFPELLATVSFPYTPVVSGANTNIKHPAWLNDVRNYHNRGNSNFVAEDSLYGDFFGLDDLFTEKPEVVQGMVDIFQHWIREYGIDGFRIDTVKHVNVEFWRVFTKAMREEANARGIGDFFMFGEVFDGDPQFLSEYTTWAGLDGVLDFGLMYAIRDFIIRNAPASNLSTLFAQDTLYLDADSDAYLLPTFVSNHDGGVERLAYYLRRDRPGLSDSQQLALIEQAHAILFFARGQPVLYYGDEQGFAGGGSDVDAREDMFASHVPSYNDNDLVGTNATTASRNFDTNHALYQALAGMSALYREHAALRSGSQVVRNSGSDSVFALSRFDPANGEEYVFVSNRDLASRSVTIATAQSSAGSWTRLGGTATLANVNGNGSLSISLPGASWGLFKGPAAPSGPAPTISFRQLVNGAVLPLFSTSKSGVAFPPRGRLAVSVNAAVDARVEFEVNEGTGWRSLGTDIEAPYEVYYRPDPSFSGARLYAFRATVRDRSGRSAVAQVSEVRAIEGVRNDVFVVHYRNPSGNYPDPASGEAWGISVSGAGVESPGFVPFRASTAYGAFAAVELTDAAQPVEFTVRRRDGGGALTQNPHRLVPARFAQVWTVAGDPSLHFFPADAVNAVRVLVKVPRDGNWRLRVATGITGPEQIVSQALASSSNNAFGRIFDVPLGSVAAALQPGHSLWVAVVTPEGGLDTAGFREIALRQATAHFWMVADDPEVHLSEAAALDIARIHYHRPDGAYGNASASNFNDFWGLHVWEGAVTETAWQNPVRPAAFDGFGAVFNVPVQPLAPRLAYIIHRGDNKDPGPDQFLAFASSGYEVWQVSGADIASPYVVTSVFVPLQAGPDIHAAAELARPTLSPDGTLTWLGVNGLTYTIQRSTDLATWQTVGLPRAGHDGLQTASVDATAPAFVRLLID